MLSSTRSSISLSNGVDIEVYPNSYKAVRGRTLLAVIFDELAFWCDEHSALPDIETYAAVTPGLGRVEDSMLIMISTAHRRAGLLYQRWQRYFGKDKDDVLVVRGTTAQFNPSYDAATIARQLAEDPELYGAEYLSQWRDDLSTFISRELLAALIDRNVTVRPPDRNIQYIAGCDASGGRNDSFTAAISHRDNAGIVHLDALFERRSPFNPS